MAFETGAVILNFIMKKLLIIIALFLIAKPFFAQKNDYGLAYSGLRVQGIYIFVMCEPYHKYEYVETVKAKINWTGSVQESFEKVIKKAKKKHPYFNGIIFQSKDLSKGDLIKFTDLEISKGGIKLNEKVSFIIKGELYAGEVIELESKRGKASVEYFKVGEKQITQISYDDLTPIDEEKFNEITSKNE